VGRDFFRLRSGDGLTTPSSLTGFNRTYPVASLPGQQPPPFVHGASNPVLLVAQTGECVRRKN
jgi:hypothetical protein